MKYLKDLLKINALCYIVLINNLLERITFVIEILERLLIWDTMIINVLNINSYVKLILCILNLLNLMNS